MGSREPLVIWQSRDSTFPRNDAQPVFVWATLFYQKMRAELGAREADLAEDAELVAEGGAGSAGAAVEAVSCDLCCLGIEGEALECPSCPFDEWLTVCRRASCVGEPIPGGGLVCKNCADAANGCEQSNREVLGCDARDGLESGSESEED